MFEAVLTWPAVRICFYTTGHGFGHAARDLAVVERLLDDGRVQVEVRTSTPRWFFDDLLGRRFTYAEVDLDPGVVQSDSFNHDLPATAAAWEALMAGAEATVLTYTAKADVGGKLAQLGSRLIDATAKKMADEFFDGLLVRLFVETDDQSGLFRIELLAYAHRAYIYAVGAA